MDGGEYLRGLQKLSESPPPAGALTAKTERKSGPQSVQTRAEGACYRGANGLRMPVTLPFARANDCLDTVTPLRYTRSR